MIIKIVNKCLNCGIKSIPFDKMLCSIKCLKETIRQCEKQNGKGTCGYDKSDVWLKPKLYKRNNIKKKTEAQLAKDEGRY